MLCPLPPSQEHDAIADEVLRPQLAIVSARGGQHEMAHLRGRGRIHRLERCLPPQSRECRPDPRVRSPPLSSFPGDVLDQFLTDPDAALRKFQLERNMHGS